VCGAASQNWREAEMNWEWLPHYLPLLMHGLYLTLVLLVTSVVFGGILAVPIGLLQVTGPWPLKMLASGFCSFIRGTPLLIQLWLIYYGIGSLFPGIPGIRTSFLWPILREGFYYAVLAFSLSFAGYEGEVMRGAFLGVPKGELEAARAIGMSPFKVLTRVWLPRAVRLVLPTLAGEIVGQLKSTPLAFTVTVMDLMGARAKISSDTYIMYEPLIFIAVIYMILTFLITRVFGYLERLVPQRR
jgi:polar amino acid transport system permease protein